MDGTRALRSPGSVLKPFIYAQALERGIIHPMTMLKDVPKNYGVYTPENFDRSFYGLLNATQALVYSRNIPAVDLLLQVGEENFYNLLKACGVQKLRPVGFTVWQWLWAELRCRCTTWRQCMRCFIMRGVSARCGFAG